MLMAGFLALPAPGAAWTKDTHRYVAENAARLMPTTMRAILYTHKDSLLAGAATVGSPETSEEHNLGGGKSDLRARILAQVQRLEVLLENRAPFREVAREMGVLSHFLADANNPLHTSESDPREGEYYHDYARYVERNLEKFPLVFSGYRAPALVDGDVAGFVDSILDRSRRRYARLGQDYFRGGKLVSSSQFDEYSFAFGIGALSTSNAVGDTAKLWLHIWEAAGGDTEGLPYADGRARAAGGTAEGKK